MNGRATRDAVVGTRSWLDAKSYSHGTEHGCRQGWKLMVKIMPSRKQQTLLHNESYLTSGGVPWSELSGVVLYKMEWMDGRHGPVGDILPSLSDLPIPQVLFEMAELQESRPRGSKAMIDHQGATLRLGDCRAGAWLVSPLTGHKWAKWPSGKVGWVPSDVHLPAALWVRSRNDVQ